MYTGLYYLDTSTPENADHIISDIAAVAAAQDIAAAIASVCHAALEPGPARAAARTRQQTVVRSYTLYARPVLLAAPCLVRIPATAAVAAAATAVAAVAVATAGAVATVLDVGHAVGPAATAAGGTFAGQHLHIVAGSVHRIAAAAAAVAELACGTVASC